MNNLYKDLKYESKTKGFIKYALIKYNIKNIQNIDYNKGRIYQNMQNKGIDYIANYNNVEIWLDSKIRTYKGKNYKDIVLETKIFDFNIKKMDYVFYVIPNKEFIESYLININCIINNPLSLNKSYIIPYKKGINDELLILNINNLIKNNFCIYKKFEYNNKYNKKYFTK